MQHVALVAAQNWGAGMKIATAASIQHLRAPCHVEFAAAPTTLLGRVYVHHVLFWLHFIDYRESFARPRGLWRRSAASHHYSPRLGQSKG